ncbi:MAG: carboxypeptidase-like regulatory domain-containing protein, partial [Flavobacteriales bacterium]|nr:carboxypeptidase-like regulatory domain-containing protein [Flavobacteriales bacterium]
MRIFILIGIVLIFSFGCVTSKSHNKVVKGSYEIINQEPYITENDSAIIIGSVFDVRTKKPLPYVNIQILNIKKGCSADSLGKFYFNIPSGIYEVEVLSVGNTEIKTKSIEFLSNTKT